MDVKKPIRGQCNGGGAEVQTASDSVDLLRRLAPASTCSLYLHVPFCFHKCHYCDFYSIVDDRDRQGAFTARLIEEIRALSPHTTGRVATIFVGGGTPTLLAADLWRSLLNELKQAFQIAPGCEFTVEANPETVAEPSGAALMETLAAGGVNRVSFGAQSFDARHLKTLERWHDPVNVARAVERAQAVGIDNINLDLIFGVPGQTLDEWRADLDAALSLGPTHLSCYALTYEPNTAMTKKLELGQIERTDDELEAAMFECTIDTLTGVGFEHYEVSNFAATATEPSSQPAIEKDEASAVLGGLEADGSVAAIYRCRHNLVYWTNGDWLALGPSASGHVGGVRWKNVPHLGKYLASTGGAPIVDIEQLDPAASVGEQLMMRLRLREGVPLRWVGDHVDPRRTRVVERFVERGLLTYTDTHLKLTRRGLLVADTITGELL